MPDFMAPKVHQNNRSYVSLADLPSDSEFSMVGGYTENPEKLQTVKIGGRHLPGRYGTTTEL